MCHVVLSCFRGEKAPRENPPNGDFRVFAWRPFAPPHESTTLFMRRLFASCLSYLCLAGRKVATQTRQNGDFFVFPHGDLSPRHTKVRDIPCVAFSATVCSRGAKGRHAKTRQNHHLAVFRMATFRVFAPKTRLYDMAQISHYS